MSELVSRVDRGDDLDRTIDEIGAAIAANSRFTGRTDKLLVDVSQQLSLADGLAYEAEHSPGAGPDTLDRLAAGGR